MIAWYSRARSSLRSVDQLLPPVLTGVIFRGGVFAFGIGSLLGLGRGAIAAGMILRPDGFARIVPKPQRSGSWELRRRRREDDMAIQVGDRVPNVKLQTMRDGKFESVQTEDFFRGRKVVLFAVPGAFTSVCSDHHLPGFIELADHLKSRGRTWWPPRRSTTSRC